MSKPKHTKYQHPSGNKPEQPQKENSNRHVYIEPGAQMDFVQSLKDQHETERTEDKTSQNEQILWTKIGAGLVALYTGVMIWQACLTRTAISNSREQFILDQRPYVWQSSIEPGAFNVGQRIFVNIHFVNYGKSPALQVIGQGKVFYGEHGLDEADKWFSSMGTGKLKDDGSGTITVIPQTVPPDPNKTPAFSTVFSEAIPDSNDVAYMINHDFAIVAVAREQYEDTYGNVYQSDLCFFRFQNGSIGQCHNHNKIR